MSDDNNVVDVSSLFGKFKNSKELKEYADKLFQVTKRLQEDCEQLRAENLHLKSLLDAAVPKLPATNKPSNIVEITPEVAIAELELSKLHQISLERRLSPDEAKLYDIYSRNLIASKKKPRPKKVDNEVVELTDADLLEVIETDDE